MRQFISAIVLFVLIALSASHAAAGGMNAVTIETSGGPQQWAVELASDDASRAKGLMYRETMAAKTGMLFRFGQTRVVAMWMKNTFIPLDMVFADQSGRVTHIHRDAVPHSLEIISSQVPASYVLEINAGEADMFGVAVGDRLVHPWILPVN